MKAVSVSQRSCLLPAIIILLGSIVLLFTRLGHYALWDDEAITAMTSRAVWQTGDTSVRVDDHNLLVYRNGLLVRNFKDRYTPPLQFYVVAPFIGILGDSSFVCRLPMAICGLLTVGIILFWLKKIEAQPAVWWATAAILLTNAEFFLFFRQCRYYGLTMFLSSAVVYLYCTHNGSARRVIGLSFALAAVLASQYLDYAALACCLVIDYVIWGRRQPFTLKQWGIIAVPQLVVGGVVCSIWNPLVHPAGETVYHSSHVLIDRLDLLWWNWRDMAACGFGIVPLVMICPLLYLKCRSQWLLRAPLALVIFVSAIAMVVPTSLAQAHNAEVRYLAPVAPLCVGIAILGICGLFSFNKTIQWSVIALSAASLFIKADDRSILSFDPVPFLYYHELAVPQQESYTPVIDWINREVPPGASIYVQPAYKTYPLMLKAPAAIYAWQLTDPPRSDFASLPAINFFGRVPPDYLIRFGTNSESRDMETALSLLASRGIYYNRIKTIHLHWRDWYRPERIWRSFTTVVPAEGDEIYIYHRRADLLPGH